MCDVDDQFGSNTERYCAAPKFTMMMIAHTTNFPFPTKKKKNFSSFLLAHYCVLVCRVRFTGFSRIRWFFRSLCAAFCALCRRDFPLAWHYVALTSTSLKYRTLVYRSNVTQSHVMCLPFSRSDFFENVNYFPIILIVCFVISGQWRHIFLWDRIIIWFLWTRRLHPDSGLVRQQ